MNTQSTTSQSLEGPSSSSERRFPVLKDDEVHDGKPRLTTLTLSKEFCDDTENIVYDRKIPNRFANTDMSSKSEAPEIINLDENDLEVSFKIDSAESRTPRKGNPIADSIKNDSEIQAIFDVMSDLNSPTLVILGDVHLSETEAQKHLKEYNDYQKKKILKNKC